MPISHPSKKIDLPPESGTDVGARSSSTRRTLFSLGARLSLCAKLVRPGHALADVGTDHGYLPVWLVLSGIIPRAIAADIRPGPLSRARENILRYHAEDKVETRLADGLSAVSPQEADDVVIAGMGGEMIAHIVEDAPWLKSAEKRLILQPMTSVEDLRAFLLKKGFAVLREQAVEEDRHLYTVMLVAYDPEPCEVDELYPYIGKVDASTPENRRYLAKQARRLEGRAAGLSRAGKTAAADRDLHLAGKIKALLPAENFFSDEE